MKEYSAISPLLSLNSNPCGGTELSEKHPLEKWRGRRGLVLHIGQFPIFFLLSVAQVLTWASRREEHQAEINICRQKN